MPHVTVEVDKHKCEKLCRDQIFCLMRDGVFFEQMTTNLETARLSIDVTRNICDLGEMQAMLNLFENAVVDYEDIYVHGHDLVRHERLKVYLSDTTGFTLIDALMNDERLSHMKYEIKQEISETYKTVFGLVKCLVKKGWYHAVECISFEQQDAGKVFGSGAEEIAALTTGYLLKVHGEKTHAVRALRVIDATIKTYLRWIDGVKSSDDMPRQLVAKFVRNLTGFDLLEYQCEKLHSIDNPYAQEQADILLNQYPQLFRALELKLMGYFGDRLFPIKDNCIKPPA